MKEPRPVNLMKSADVRAAGWAAEARDEDGHLMTVLAPFGSPEDRNRYVAESMSEGWNVTIWASGRR